MAPPTQVILCSAKTCAIFENNQHFSTDLSPLLAKARFEEISDDLLEQASSSSTAVIHGTSQLERQPTNLKNESSLDAPDSSCETTLIGDGSKKFVLPCSPHESTVLIKPAVLIKLLDGVYSTDVKRFHIFDCRYPYEFDGGHVAGAANVPTFENLETSLSGVDEEGDDRRRILVFHCEFSSQRAPSLLRQLRKADRDRNSSRYPRLDYPEVYLLEGGYKAFFDLCRATNRLDLIDTKSSPVLTDGYVTMRDERFRGEERRWRRLHLNEKQNECQTALINATIITSSSSTTSPCAKSIKLVRRNRSAPTSVNFQHVRRLAFDDEESNDAAAAVLLSATAPINSMESSSSTQSTPSLILLEVNVELDDQPCHLEANGGATASANIGRQTGAHQTLTQRAC